MKKVILKELKDTFYETCSQMTKSIRYISENQFKRTLTERKGLASRFCYSWYKFLGHHQRSSRVPTSVGLILSHFSVPKISGK